MFELIPAVKARFAGVALLTNAMGFRDVDRTVAKPQGTRRIVAIGDSLLFGWGVSQEDRVTERLQAVLDSSGESWEVLNFGVPGYNTVQEARLLESRLLAYEPDVVVVLVCLPNDHLLPNFISSRPHIWSLRRSFAWELLSMRQLKTAPAWERWGIRPVQPLDAEVPEAYKKMVGRGPQKEAFRRIVAAAHRVHATPIALVDSFWFERVAPGAAEGGFLVDDVHTRQVAVLRETGFDVADASSALVEDLGAHRWHSQGLFVSARDAHPNELRHAFLARALHDRLVALGLTRRVRDRVWAGFIENARRKSRAPGRPSPAHPTPGVPSRHAIDFRNGAGSAFLGSGWCAGLREGAVACGTPANINFALSESTALEIRLQLSCPPELTGVPIRVTLNGLADASVVPTKDPAAIVLTFPARSAFSGVNRLIFEPTRFEEVEVAGNSWLGALFVTRAEFSTLVGPP